jgi:hypothetical protein
MFPGTNFILNQKTKAGMMLNKAIFNHKYGGGINIIRRDWDNCIILDAMRYDIFADINCFDGHLNPVISGGGNSFQFVEHNFEGRELHDTIYVTANGWIEKLASDPFFVTKKTYGNFEKRYEHYHPKNVESLSLEAYDNHPDKRLIIHFMQPHVPYLGSKADQIRDRLATEEGIQFKSIGQVRGNNPNESRANKTVHSLLNAAREGYLSNKELREVYVENAELVLEHVKDIQSELAGKTVITADHGELLGENPGILYDQRYGHGSEIYSRILREVPWLELDYTSRRDIIKDEPKVSESVDEEAVKESLKALGYR